MSEIKSSGLKPLRSSTNIINNRSLFESKKSLSRSSTVEKSEPKVSLTEQIESNTPTAKVIITPSTKSTNKSTNKSTSKSSTKSSNHSIVESKSQSHHKLKSIKKCSKQTTLTPDAQIRRGGLSVEQKKVKKAIKTLLSKEQRIKQWLTSKETIEDAEYWRLYSERLGKELIESLDQLDEIELENELLIAEFNEMAKLTEKAFKLNSLLNKIGLSSVLNGDSDE